MFVLGRLFVTGCIGIKRIVKAATSTDRSIVTEALAGTKFTCLPRTATTLTLSATGLLTAGLLAALAGLIGLALLILLALPWYLFGRLVHRFLLTLLPSIPRLALLTALTTWLLLTFLLFALLTAASGLTILLISALLPARLFALLLLTLLLAGLLPALFAVSLLTGRAFPLSLRTVTLLATLLWLTLPSLSLSLLALASPALFGVLLTAAFTILFAALPVLVALCPSYGIARVLRPFAGLAFEFSGELIVERPQFFQCPFEHFRVVAEDTLGRLIDILPEPRYAFSGPALFAPGIVQQAPFERTLGRFESPLGVLPLILSNRVVQLFGQQRLRGFRFLDGPAHLIEQLAELLTLLAQTFGDLRSFFTFSELPRLFCFRIETFEPFAEFLFALVETLRRVAHLPHLFIELAGGSFLKLIA